MKTLRTRSTFKSSTLIALTILLTVILSLSPALAQDATDVLIWSLGYGGDYPDTLVERF